MPEPLPKFKSPEYGFSFDYSEEWSAVEKDLPDKWAITDANDNTIIFIVSQPSERDLMAVGISQALNDVYPEKSPEDISQNELQQIYDMVKLQTFNEKEWFTYGVNFAKLKTQSLISGTLCGNNEILMVLVTEQQSYDALKLQYNKILESFKC